jgi:voltage-gated potassium channel
MKHAELKPAYHALVLLFIILITGVLGFIIIEHYSFLDAFFMTIITVTTVGFGEVHPLTPGGKIFTSLLIIFSVGIIAFAASTLARYVVSGVILNFYKFSKMKKEIDKLNNHVIVVGYGRNGSQAIDELINRNIPVIVIDNRDSKINEVKLRESLLYIHDDPSSDEVLVNAGVKRAKALISVLPTDEENLFAVLTTHELNPLITIISRAINVNTIKKLKIAGASHVIMPDKISGQQMAKMIAQPDIVEFLDFLMLEKSKDFHIGEVGCTGILDQSIQTIGQLDFQKFGTINIIGIKKMDGNYIVNPGPHSVLDKNDLLFVLGKPDEIIEFKKYLDRDMKN